MDTNLLEAENDEYLQNLLLQAAHNQPTGDGAKEPNYHAVLPKPGFCLKTKDDKDNKIFINVCQAENIPVPVEKTDEELALLLEKEEPSDYSIPMSLGEPHAELDHGGHGCTAYDVVISPEFFKQLHVREMVMAFFLTVVLQGIEYKYDITLQRSWKILKNKKFIGTLPEQYVRKKSMKSLISDLQSPGIKKSLITEMESNEEGDVPKAPEPPYTMIQEPPSGHPEYIVAEIHLPKVKSAASLSLDIGEDRILLKTRSNIYYLDIYLPFNLVQEDCGAQFNRDSKTLTITMPVQPL